MQMQILTADVKEEYAGSKGITCIGWWPVCADSRQRLINGICVAKKHDLVYNNYIRSAMNICGIQTKIQ